VNQIDAPPGTTVTRDIVVWSNAAGTIPLNLTGGSVTFVVYDAPQGAVVTGLTKAVTITDASNGKVTMTIDTPNSVHVYYYVVTLTELDHTVTEIDNGKLVIHAD
jgi:hypothetical protein